jgi:hypothetical protein
MRLPEGRPFNRDAIHGGLPPHTPRRFMNNLNRKLTRTSLILSLGALLLPLNPAWAESDKEIQEKALKAREMQQAGDMDHAGHNAADASAGKFRGVYYGYLPCQEKDCNGIKMTLSLNAKNRYLLVIQPAKPQNRESFEKGRYEWDEKERIVVLNPNKEAPQRRLTIRDDSTLLYLTSDGSHMTGEQDRYLLERSDQSNNREMHIH